MEAQEVFATVKNHLLNQKVACKSNSGRSLYKSVNGLQCAVGCLLQEDEYNKRFQEGFSVSAIALPLRLQNHKKLLGKLQYCHDKIKPGNWEQQLQKIAKEFNLDY